jgi:hypothetical protein
MEPGSSGGVISGPGPSLRMLRNAFCSSINASLIVKPRRVRSIVLRTLRNPVTEELKFSGGERRRGGGCIRRHAEMGLVRLTEYVKPALVRAPRDDQRLFSRNGVRIHEARIGSHDDLPPGNVFPVTLRAPCVEYRLYLFLETHRLFFTASGNKSDDDQNGDISHDQPPWMVKKTVCNVGANIANPMTMSRRGRQGVGRFEQVK